MNTARGIWRTATLGPLAFAVALGIAVSGCEPSGEKMGTLTGPMPEAPPPVVVRDQVRHLTMNLRADGAIEAAQWSRIDHFLGDAAPGRPDTVRLTVAGDASPAVIDLVIRHAFAFGYAENKIEVAPPTRFAGGVRMTLRLTSKTSVAILPNCPQTTHLNIIDRDNQVGSDWGCSTVTDLELQVADPHDLVHGQGGGETDSVIATAAIHRLETDKVKKLEAPSSTASVTGTGGGSQ
jgi:type IV pilus biogenesis protein CpaD/CtpE